MATVEISKTGEIRIPTDIRKKYRIKGGTKVSIYAENGVIVIRPAISQTLEFAKKSLLRGSH